MVTGLSGASYTWIGTNSLTNYWTNTANWVPTGYPDGVGDVADFRVTQSTDTYVSVDVPVTVGTLLTGNTTGVNRLLQILGSGTLRLEDPSGTALMVHKPAVNGSGFQIINNIKLASDLLISNQVSGSSIWIMMGAISETNARRLTFIGSNAATLNIYGHNTYSGGTTLVSGILNYTTSTNFIPDNPATSVFGRGPVTLLGGFFRPHAGSNIMTNANTLILAGDITIPVQSVETNSVLLGTVILSNGTHTLTQNMGMTNAFAGVTFAGPIVDAPGESNSLILAGTGITTFAATNTYRGDTVIRSGRLRLGCPNGMPVGVGKGNLLLSPGASTNAIFDLNGKDVSLNAISNEGGGRAWIDNLSNNTTNILTIGSNDRDMTYSGLISNSAGSLKMVQVGGGSVTLTNATVYLFNRFDMNGSTGGALHLAGSTFFKVQNMTVGGGASGCTVNISGTSRLDSGNLFIGQLTGSGATLNQSGGIVSLSTHLRVGHWPSETSVYNLSGGTLSITGTLTNNPYSTGGFEYNGVLYLGIDGTGIFNQSGGSVVVPAIVMDNRSDTPGTDQYNLTGGSLTLTSPWGISGNPSAAFTLGNGSFTPPVLWTNGSPLQFAIGSNNTLSGVHTNQTPVLLTNGALVFTGTMGPGTSFTVSNGALLAGTGAMAGSLAVGDRGVLAPGSLGNSPGLFNAGVLSFQPGSIYAVDIDGAGMIQDQVVASSAITCGGTLVITNYGNPVTGALFPILSAPTVSGAFAGLGDGTFFAQQGRIFLCRYSPSNVTLQDEGTNSSLPFIGLQDTTPFPVTNGVLRIVGFSSNFVTANGMPAVFTAVNGATNQYFTNGSPWIFSVDTGSLPEGTNAIIFTAVSSNGSSNQVHLTNIIDRTPPTAPVLSPATNRFPTTVAVQMTASDTYGVSTIYHTLDGSIPTILSASVTNGGSVTLSSTCVLTARAVDLAGNMGPATQGTYTYAPETDGNGKIRSVQPNPFRPAQGHLLVSMVCTNQETLEVSVVDIQGRTVAVLSSVRNTALQQANIIWDGILSDGRTIPRGMYFLLPRVSGIVRVEQMRRLYVP